MKTKRDFPAADAALTHALNHALAQSQARAMAHGFSGQRQQTTPNQGFEIRCFIAQTRSRSMTAFWPTTAP